MNDSFIQINRISKHFGNVKAVDDVSFQIKEGEFFSLLGPSGFPNDIDMFQMKEIYLLLLDMMMKLGSFIMELLFIEKGLQMIELIKN